MIGQRVIQARIEEMIPNFPRFLILEGAWGSGKKLLAKQISKMLNLEFVLVGTGVSDVRDAIASSNTVTVPTMYVIADADSMSVVAKNALLKVLEEPSNNAYFVMTLQSTEFMLPTILSRGQVLSMDLYTTDDILAYYNGFGQDIDEVERAVVRCCCETPGEVELLRSQNAKEFKDYVQLVFDNIAKVSGSNSFKMSSKLALKSGDEGFDLPLFWKMFIQLCEEHILDDSRKYSKGILVTTKYLNSLKNVSLNKQYIFDMWLLDIRKRWI